MPSGFVAESFKPQAKVTVGTTRAQLSDVSAQEIFISADSANSGSVYIGDNTVTSTGGGNCLCKLTAGSGITVQAKNANLFYVVGSAAGQVVYWGAFD